MAPFFKKYHETGIFDEKEIYPYITEGIGEDILPKNVDFSLIDHFEKVSDKDGALGARALATKEGLLLGYSAGSAIAGLNQLSDQLLEDDVVVIIFHDHGSRYVGKIFNDDWMLERGFLDREKTVTDVLSLRDHNEFIAVESNHLIREVFNMMKAHDISQLPILENNEIVGSISETAVLNYLLENPMAHAEEPVSVIMESAFPEVKPDLPISELNRFLSKKVRAVIVRKTSGEPEIITQYDVLRAV